CRDLMYIAEPVVLVLATHAQPDGITVDGQTIGIPALLDSLRHAGSLRHVHFSACLLMKDPGVVKVLGEFATQTRMSMSGYTTSVNWAQTAIIEFTSLEILLARDMTRAGAADQLRLILPFAGHAPVTDSAFPPAGFTMVLPQARTPTVDEPAKPKRR